MRGRGLRDCHACERVLGGLFGTNEACVYEGVI